MSIVPVGLSPALQQPQTNASLSTVQARSGAETVEVRFAPTAKTAGPLDQMGTGIVSKLRAFEQRRADSANAMSGMQPGPANPVDVEKASLLSGPASQSLAASAGMKPTAATKPDATGDAVAAMTRSFDYAIETQLIVKTGSQLSSSTSSLMRGG